MASVLDKVRGLIERLSPEPVCEECGAERLQLSTTSQANKKTRAGRLSWIRAEAGRLFAVRRAAHGDPAARGLT